jgi:hypothetical protein
MDIDNPGVAWDPNQGLPMAGSVERAARHKCKADNAVVSLLQPLDDVNTGQYNWYVHFTAGCDITIIGSARADTR